MPSSPLMETDLTVTIFKTEYNDLIADRDLLTALYDAGVDNWEGYEIAKDFVSDS